MLTRVNHLLAINRPVVIAIAGAVGVGKTTYAKVLADAVDELIDTENGTNVATVVSTDGFLLPNAVLEAKGLINQKGFPETFDDDALRWFLETIRTDHSIIGLPRYSHDSFDVEVSEEPFLVTPVIVVEGVNALQPAIAQHYDLRLYLDADPTDIVDWYVDRFVNFTTLARESGSGFYTRFIDLSPAALQDTARWVYDTINLPNLVEHIEPTKAQADVIVFKDRDHSSTITLVDSRSDPSRR